MGSEALYGWLSFLTNKGDDPMKRVLLTGVALAALTCGSALAADLPVRRQMPVKAPEAVPMYYNWTGFYIGGHAGGGFGDTQFTSGGFDDGKHDHDGFVGGGQVGFNVQSNQFVFGVEFSGSWADLTGSHNAVLGGIGDSYHSDINTILLLTGRVGVAFDRALLYVNGGGAWVRNKVEYTVPGLLTSEDKQNRTGWTVGAGLEYGLAPNWSVAVQYNFIDLGDKGVNLVEAGGPFTASADTQLHVVTARLNHRFGWGGGPIVARY
jgi:outer membrane immunogenic protein